MGHTLKERVYDESISSLMTQIIAICKENKIAMLADFDLGFDEEEGSELKCTTFLLKEEFEPTEKMLEAARVLQRKPSFFTTMVVSSK